MRKRVVVVLAAMAVAVTLGVGLAPGAMAQAERNFGAGFWGDGDRWGTIVTPALLPDNAPLSSFDGFYIVMRDGAMAQAPVVEAAPGNPAYNGGRWATYTAVWTEQGILDHGGDPPVLTSYADLQFHAGLGHLDVTLGTFPGGPPAFFECPLVPYSG